MTTAHQDEIQKILKMNKAGTLTDDQASELLAEMMKNRRTSKPDWAGAADGLGEAIGSLTTFIEKTVDGAISAVGAKGTHTSKIDGIFASEMQENQFSMSKVDSPNEGEFIFKGNHIRMSHLSDMELDHAELTGNRIDASKVEGLTIQNGKLADSIFQASAVENFKIDTSQVQNIKLLSSKFCNATVEDESAIEGVKVNASAIKGLHLTGGSQWRDTVISGAAIKDLEAKDTKLTGVELQGVHLHNVKLTSSDLQGLFLRGVYLHQSEIVASKMNDVLISGGDSWNWKNWRKRGFDRVSFESCDFEKVLFSDCRFSKTVIRNVTLKDFKVKNVDLSGLTLDGTEAFLAAIRSAKPATQQTG